MSLITDIIENEKVEEEERVDLSSSSGWKLNLGQKDTQAVVGLCFYNELIIY